MKIQLIFGSPNDERVYGPLCHALEKCGEIKMEVASAHRHPERVRELVREGGADIFVTGAGLAAHLPGVVASMTEKPVFGVAINGAFAGLDAFLSIVQMPKGVPVMAVTEENSTSIADLLGKWNYLPTDRIYLHWNRDLENYSPIQTALDEMKNQSGCEVIWTQAQEQHCLGEIVTPWEVPRGTGLNLFLCEKEQLVSAQLALDFYAKARHGGAWVGANNITNYVKQWQKLCKMKSGGK
jgi:5-(carboxyamino)imidazole ribonucleotide mutase